MSASVIHPDFLAVHVILDTFERIVTTQWKDVAQICVWDWEGKASLGDV